MSGVCGLDDDTVEIQPEEILPLVLGSLFLEMGWSAAADICHRLSIIADIWLGFIIRFGR